MTESQPAATVTVSRSRHALFLTPLVSAPRVQGVWKDHTDFYSCNQYGADKKTEKESAKTASRAALDRYLFYYHRCDWSSALTVRSAAARSPVEAPEARCLI